MSTTEKTTTTKPKSVHYHAWRSDQTDDEAVLLHKVGPAFETRRAARVWLRDRRHRRLARAFICTDAACPALAADSGVAPESRPLPAPGSQPGGSPF